MAQAREQHSFLVDLLVGSVSAAFSKTVIAPVERVKLLLQLQDASAQMTASTRYTGILDCVKRVHSEQGLLSFWRGNFVSVCRYFPNVAFTFATKDWFKRSYAHYDPEKERWKFWAGNVLSGGFAGSIATMVTYPLDFARTRLAVDVGRIKAERQFTGFWDCMRKILRAEGVFGVYRGVLLTLLNSMLYRGFYFGVYDSWTHKLRRDEKLPAMKLYLIANSVTAVGTVLVYPLDTVRRRLMMQSGRADVLYNGASDCVRKIYSQEGLKGFYKGGLVNLTRSSGGALVLVLYDKLREVLRYD